jgi:predicted ABC-type ATPase
MKIDQILAEMLLNDQDRMVLLVLAGSNGAGKSTFYERYIAPRWNAPFVNADVIAKELFGTPSESRDYMAARLAETQRQALIARRASFVFETVFSDPNGAKLELLTQAAQAGYRVVLIFIGIPNVTLSQARVMGRVQEGGHDVPDDKLLERFPRTLVNLRNAIRIVDTVLMLDNSDPDAPYQPVALTRAGTVLWRAEALPAWATSVLNIY